MIINKNHRLFFSGESWVDYMRQLYSVMLTENIKPVTQYPDDTGSRFSETHPVLLLIVSFFVTLVLPSCRLDPSPFPKHLSGNQLKTSFKIVSEDPVAASVICHELARNASFNTVGCSESQKRMGAGLELIIRTEIDHPSGDYWRNTWLSLATLTTLMLVTTSAEITYNFIFRKDGHDLKAFSLKSRGYIGVWGLQPPVTAFIGMSIGTAINSDKRPDRLHAECTSLADRRPDIHSKNCQAYRRFIQDSLSYVWSDYLKEQQLFYVQYTKKQPEKTDN